MGDLKTQTEPLIETDLLEDYRGTGLGLLPKNWQVVRLAEVVQKTRQADPRKNPDQNFRYVDVSAVSRERLAIQGYAEYKGKDAPSRARKLIQFADVVFATVRPSLRRVAVVPSELDGHVCSTAFCVIRARTGIVDPSFLFFVSSMDAFVERVAEHQRGSNYPAVADKDVLGEQIPLPPLSEQKAIAHVLSTVQKAIETTEKVIEASKELKRSLMKHLFTYGPVSVDEAEQVPLKETPYGSVPGYWHEVNLEDCALVQTGVTKGRKLKVEETVEVPYLRVANVQDGYLDLQEIKTIRIHQSEVPRYKLRKGDVLLTEGGDFDKLGRGFVWNEQIPDCIHQNHVFAVRVDGTLLSPEFLAYLAQSRYGKSYFLQVAHRTTNLASINSTKLKAFPVLLPPLDEQDEIVRLLEKVDAKTSVEENRKRSLQVLFETLLHNLMTGRVRVNNVDFSAVEEMV